MLYTSIVAERIGLRRSFAVIMAMSFALNFILALAPVSYTHLDVYKRQGFGRFLRIFCLSLVYT